MITKNKSRLVSGSITIICTNLRPFNLPANLLAVLKVVVFDEWPPSIADLVPLCLLLFSVIPRISFFP